VLLGHVQPDGDALGSALALGLVLSATGRATHVTYPGAPLRPTGLDWLPGMSLVTAPSALPPRPALVVCLDASSRDRLADLAGYVEAAPEVMVVDHHSAGETYGTVRLVDPGAAATAVLVAALISRLGVPLDRQIATCLYTGLVTDTGSFKFASTTSEVHCLAAELIAAGAPHAEIARRVFDTRSYAGLSILGRALRRARLEPDAGAGLGLVWTVTTAADLVETGAGVDDLESVIDVVRTVGEADVSAVAKTHPDGAVVVSLRSRGSVDVGALAQRLGGGGHRGAAGFTAVDGVEGAIAAVRNLLVSSRLAP
jgi:phosphoesterase RecJ-like protein